MTGAWRKPARSHGAGGNCVEARLWHGQPQLRDSKMGDASPILKLDRADFTALLVQIR
ncbi:uncharacterized protein DUF397 [Stackebrandtia albiflava]|uniref:Uncharacterized protein DUF397 n=1 Tax=Stackebrandtia albiflava TaxID=406432 RepID=A0A562UQC1_9ACTN|nr:DUF397 domain-containing protein [Stackebrandtia albiflava]TWJ07794.1 uncharacterized protein DUF397 [Stackebrandtia albiflava]